MVVPDEIVVQPFASQEPVVPKLPFKSHACHPTELVEFVSLGLLEERHSQPHKVNIYDIVNTSMAPSNASGAIEKPIGKYQVAKSTAGGCQFFYLDVACEVGCQPR